MNAMGSPPHNLAARVTGRRRCPGRRAVRPRRGMAMVLVTVATGLATAMAVALLAGNSIRAQTAANAADATVAHYLAESGANVAMYYLMYPERYGGSMPQGFYPGEDPVLMGPDFPGQVETRVSYNAATQVYTVTTVGSLTASASNHYSRQLDATVRVIDGSATQLDVAVDALVTNGGFALTANTTIDGSIKSLGSVTVMSGTITGSVAADTITVGGAGSVVGQTRSLTDGLLRAETTGAAVDLATLRDGLTSLVPAVAAVRDLRAYTTVDGTGATVLNAATKLALDTYGTTTMGTTAANPAGIYWIDQDLTIEGNTTINGTLVLRGGRLRIKTGAMLTLRPANGYPALVSDDTIQMDTAGLFSADGLVMAKNIQSGSGGATGAFAVNGALLLSDPIKPLPTAAEYAGTIAVRYNKTKATASGFGTVRPPAFSRGVKLLAWSD